MATTSTIEAIVLKRKNYGEADRIVTVFSLEQGKLTLLAKSVRFLHSKRAGSLEVGTQIKAQVIRGKGMDILGQTVIINSFSCLKTDLTKITCLYQLLEIVDNLTSEDQENPEVYRLLINTLRSLSLPAGLTKVKLLTAFHAIAQSLGFSDSLPLSELALKTQIESIADKKLRSKDFLSPKAFKDSP